MLYLHLSVNNDNINKK